MKTHNYPLFFIFLLTSALNVHAAQEPTAVETRIKTLLIDPNSQSPVVVLETVREKTPLPIWIDAPEARAIALELEHVSLPRPLTHDLIRNLLQSLGAHLQRVTITEMRNNTYFASLTIAVKEKVTHVDSRPSDAIAIALRMKAPIFVSTKVLANSKPTPVARFDQTQKRLGFQAQDLTADLAKLFDSQHQNGVLVTDVTMVGAAMKAGLQRGDIITKANEQAISSIKELESVIQAVKSPSQLRLRIIKKGKPTTIMIDLPS